MKEQTETRVEIITETKVVNIKTFRGPYEYIGRGSVFGNPYPITKGRISAVGKRKARQEVIDHYRKWFRNKLRDEEFRIQVLALKGKNLGCFCAPKRCHGEIIKAFLDGLEDDPKLEKFDHKLDHWGYKLDKQVKEDF